MKTTFQLLAIFSVVIIKIHTIPQLPPGDKLLISGQQNVYYVENEEKYTWFQALTKCARMDMSLVTIDTQEKSNDLNALLIEHFGGSINPLWIGALLDGVHPYQYTWISTGESFDFANWADGQPNFASHNEYCIQAASSEDPNTAIQWKDEKCSRTYGLICEYSRYHNLQAEMQDKLQKDLIVQQQQQSELDKSKLFIRFLMDYRRPEYVESGNKTIRDIILNIN